MDHDNTPPSLGDGRESPGDPGFSRAKVRDAARRHPEVTNAEFRVLDALLSFADASTDDGRWEGGNAYPSLKEIGRKCGRARETVEKVVKALDQKGWIRRIPFHRKRGGGRSSHLYQFRIPQAASEGPMEGPICWSKRKGVEPDSALSDNPGD